MEGPVGRRPLAQSPVAARGETRARGPGAAEWTGGRTRARSASPTPTTGSVAPRRPSRGRQAPGAGAA